MNPLLMDTLSLGGALVAGVRMGAVSIYAKSGFTEWRGEAYQPRPMMAARRYCKASAPP